MRNRQSAQEGRDLVLPKVLGPKPWDFPVGSVQSRAAARAVVAAYVEQERKELEVEFGKDLPQVLLMMEGLSARARNFWVQLSRVARARAEAYDLDFTLPTVEEIRRNRASSTG